MLLILAAMILYSYSSAMGELNSSHQLRLKDLLSHLLATVEKKSDLRELSNKLELYTRSTTQAEFFKLHLFLVEGNKIIDSTDRAAVGKSLQATAPILKPFSFRRGETSVRVSAPVDERRQLVAHEDITMQSAALRKTYLGLTAVILALISLFAFAMHKLFRIRIHDSIEVLKNSVLNLSSDFRPALSEVEISREFQPLLEVWSQTVQHIGPAIQKLVEAERKASIVLIANSINHCLERISNLLLPIAFLPSKALSASEINAMKEAEHVIRELRTNLENINIDPEPFHLCQRILRTQIASGSRAVGAKEK